MIMRAVLLKVLVAMAVRMCIALGELSLIVFYLWMLPVTGRCLFFAGCTVSIKALCLLIYLVFTTRKYKILIGYEPFCVKTAINLYQSKNILTTSPSSLLFITMPKPTDGEKDIFKHAKGTSPRLYHQLYNLKPKHASLASISDGLDNSW